VLVETGGGMCAGNKSAAHFPTRKPVISSPATLHKRVNNYRVILRGNLSYRAEIPALPITNTLEEFYFKGNPFSSSAN